MNLSFKNKIAIHFMIATAIIIAVVFITIYILVKNSTFREVDNVLTFEAYHHIEELLISETDISFKNQDEWKESEHVEVQINPIFVQIVDVKGTPYTKSPNLKNSNLKFNNLINDHVNTVLNDEIIRQVQTPLIENDKLRGYIITAVSLNPSIQILDDLRYTLFTLFPIVLVILFFMTSFLAGRSILPVVNVIQTTNRITQNNLNERVDFPSTKDVLFDLSSSINDLLDRIENAIKREKQFTSDASHELKTPLSILRITLELLITRPRTHEEYESKIKSALVEIDRLTLIMDQLLQVARLDSNPALSKLTCINKLILEILDRKSSVVNEKNIHLVFSSVDETFKVAYFYANLILDNLIDNAIKYSSDNSRIIIELVHGDGCIIFKLTDFGIGINEKDLSQLFTPFFRSDYLNHIDIKGTGLGLAIVKKAADAINAEVSIMSKEGIGTEVSINFKEI